MDSSPPHSGDRWWGMLKPLLLTVYVPAENYDTIRGGDHHFVLSLESPYPSLPIKIRTKLQTLSDGWRS